MKALCWWSMRPKVWRRRHWRMRIWRSITVLEIIPVINKIDLPSADVERAKEMIEGAVGIDASDALPIRAKTGHGVPEVLEAIVKKVPPPKGSPDSPLQALIFDSAGLIRIVAWLCWRACFMAHSHGPEDPAVVRMAKRSRLKRLGALTPKASGGANARSGRSRLPDCEP